MPVDVDWLNEEQTIIRFQYSERWTWQEFDEALAVSEQMHATVAHQVVGIADLTVANVLPSGPLFAKSRETLSKAPANAHPTLIVAGANSIVQALGNTFNIMYGKRLGHQAVFVRTVEEAIAKADELLAGD